MRNPIFSIIENNPNLMNNQMNPQMNPQMNSNQPNFNANNMKEMIQLFRDNPQLLNTFNNLVTQKNENYINNPLLNDQYLQQAAQRQIPRNVFNQLKDDNKIYDANSKGTISEKMNVVFQLTSGKKFIISAAVNMSLKKLFKKFVRKIGFDEKILQKDIYFLYKGERMNINEEKDLRNMELYDNAIILVMDVQGIIGADK